MSSNSLYQLFPNKLFINFGLLWFSIFLQIYIYIYGEKLKNKVIQN